MSIHSRVLTAVRGALLIFMPFALVLHTDARSFAGKIPHVGFLLPGARSAPIMQGTVANFTEGLREHGYQDGANIAIEYRYGELDPERTRRLARELVALHVDVIVAAGTPAALAAKQATQTIPIVVGAMADPIADGLVETLARPGGNITGVTFLAPELGGKRLQLLREIIPTVTRVAVLEHPHVYSERTMRDMIADLDVSAKAMGVELQVFGAAAAGEFDGVFGALTQARMGALILLSSPMFYVEHKRLVQLAAKHRLPTMYYFTEAVEAGGLMSYGAAINDLFRTVAKYVDKILKGARPGDLPVERPVKFELAVNVPTAKSLGLVIPRSILLRADRVIE